MKKPSSTQQNWIVQFNRSERDAIHQSLDYLIGSLIEQSGTDSPAAFAKRFTMSRLREIKEKFI